MIHLQSILSVEPPQRPPRTLPSLYFLFNVDLLTLLRADHHFGYKVDDGACRLLGVVLCKQVTHVVRGCACFSRHEAKDPAEEKEERRTSVTTAAPLVALPQNGHRLTLQRSSCLSSTYDQ